MTAVFKQPTGVNGHLRTLDPKGQRVSFLTSRSQRSVYLYHIDYTKRRNMKGRVSRNGSGRLGNPPARKKACKQCTQAKVRCGHERPECRRCALRHQACEYFNLPKRTDNSMLSTTCTPA